jgi:hypothetical protein
MIFMRHPERSQPSLSRICFRSRREFDGTHDYSGVNTETDDVPPPLLEAILQL